MMGPRKRPRHIGMGELPAKRRLLVFDARIINIVLLRLGAYVALEMFRYLIGNV